MNHRISIRRKPYSACGECFRKMTSKLLKISLFFVVALLCGVNAAAQENSRRPPTDDPLSNETQPRSIKEMLVKKRIEQEKKEHEDLLKRGQEAIEISDHLERSFAQHNQLSPMDKEKLDELTSIVKKIRREIGAEDDGETGPTDRAEGEDDPTTLQSAFKVLQTTTVKLVDELKKMTRFTISAVAIRSSNSLLRIVRFIRGK
jgi:hypothetical protein